MMCMSINYSFRIIVIGLCLYLSGLNVSAQVQVRNTIWDGEDFFSTPACRVVKEDSIPVSYTHLTLPTKLEV